MLKTITLILALLFVQTVSNSSWANQEKFEFLAKGALFYIQKNKDKCFLHFIFLTATYADALFPGLTVTAVDKSEDKKAFVFYFKLKRGADINQGFTIYRGQCSELTDFRLASTSCRIKGRNYDNCFARYRGREYENGIPISPIEILDPHSFVRVEIPVKPKD